MPKRKEMCTFCTLQVPTDLSLLTTESNPKEKEQMIALITQLLK